MDYITTKIKQKIDRFASKNDRNGLATYYRLKVEYYLILILAYLWNKNKDLLDLDTKENFYSKILRPSIGTICELGGLIDSNNEVFIAREVIGVIGKYTFFRNEYIGHGYVFEDKVDSFLDEFKELIHNIERFNIPIIIQDNDFITIEEFDGDVAKGTRYKTDLNILPFTCSKNVFNFELNQTYFEHNKAYYRLSPFIDFIDEDNIFLFVSVKEKILGKVKYVKLFNSGVNYRGWKEFKEVYFENDGIRKISLNETIVNIFENNYDNYIDIGLKDKIKKFIISNRSSVCLTLWGHGGIGKTATIQSVLDDLCNSQKKYFDYIIFLTAKDRYYNYFSGEILSFTPSASSLEDLVSSINRVFNIESKDESEIVNFNGKVLIVIDDIETFVLEEREKIKEFIHKLNINNHKVVITTRMNLIVGDEIQTDDLSANDTIIFLIQVLKNHFKLTNRHPIILKLEQDKSYPLKIHSITMGRPLFILQFANILVQKGTLDEIENISISQSENAFEFLYGRMYENLSELSKRLFECMSLLVVPDDLSNLTEKLIYILNLEDDEYNFLIGLKELEKLKIIKLDEENKYFEVYSKEILEYMKRYFEKRNKTWKKDRMSRLNQVNRDKTLDVEQSLLLSANQNRLLKSENEVIEGFRQILNRTTNSEKIKISALKNLTAYLLDRGKRSDALKVLDDNFTNFKSNPNFIKVVATCNWGNGNQDERKKSVEILTQFFVSKKNLDLELNSELMGLLILYKSIFNLNKWNDIHDDIKLKKISDYEFKRLRTSVYKDIESIFNSGYLLFTFVEKNKLDEFTTGARTNIISGLYQFLFVCIKLKKFELIDRICDYMLYFAPKNFHKQFEKIKEKANWIQYKNKKRKINA